MPFKPGKPKTGGRKPGVKNKKSFLVKDVLENHGINLAEQIVVRLKQLSALEQVRALVQLLPYVYPKLTAIQHTGTINISDADLGGLHDDELDSILIEAARTNTA